MNDTRERTGATASLLDRLIDDDPSGSTEPRPLRVVGMRELRRGVQRDLVRLLNTRSPIAWSDWGDRERTVVDYGVPDLSAFFPASQADRKLLEGMLGECIMTFEPRLYRVRVHANKGSDPRRLYLRIEAQLAIENIREPVSFEIVIRDRGDSVIEVVDNG